MQPQREAGGSRTDPSGGELICVQGSLHSGHSVWVPSVLVSRATAHSHNPGFSHRRDAQKKGHTHMNSDSSFQQTGACSHLVPGWQEMDSGTHFVQDIMNHFKVLFLCQLEDSPSLARPEDLGGRAAPLARKPQGPNAFRAALQTATHPAAKPEAGNRLSMEAEASGRAAKKDSPRRWHGKRFGCRTGTHQASVRLMLPLNPCARGHVCRRHISATRATSILPGFKTYSCFLPKHFIFPTSVTVSNGPTPNAIEHL